MVKKSWKNIALSVIVAGGMTGFATIAQAHDYSQATIRSAQQRLKDDGLYSGSVDGVDGPMTHAAIRRFQQQNNLTGTGRLDIQTCDKLGVQCGSMGEANRSAAENGATSAATNRATTPAAKRSTTAQANRSNSGEANRSENNGEVAPSSATISAAQRRLQKNGFYKGNVDGQMGPETQAAVREYQKSSNLNVTGRLDQATLSKLGVSK